MKNDLVAQLATHPVEKLRELVAVLPSGSTYAWAAREALKRKDLTNHISQENFDD
jgi:hypothetical protein